MHNKILADLIDFIHAQLMKGHDCRLAGKELIPELTFGCTINEKLCFIPMQNAYVHYQSDELKRRLRHVVRDEFQRLQEQTERKGDIIKLLAVVQLLDVYLEDIKDVKFERPGRRIPFIPVAGNAVAVLAQVSLQTHEVLFKWPYVPYKDSFIFADGPSTMASQHIPGVDRTGGMWPL